MVRGVGDLGRMAIGALVGILLACAAIAPTTRDYVNRGTDPRILEHVPVVGPLSKGLQNMLSFRSANPPQAVGVPLKRRGHIAVCWPPFFTVATAKANGRYWTFRIGWRWDSNWPGYVADVIVKTDMKTPVSPLAQ